MACAKNLSLSAQVDDVPLSQAIYVGALNKIMACRGKWLYKFNAETGKKEAEMRFADGVINESYLCNIGTNIYVAAWRGVIERFPAFTPYSRPNRDVFKIDGTTMTLTAALDVKTQASTEFYREFGVGFRNIVTDGTLLYGLVGISTAENFFRVDPLNVAGTYVQGGGVGTQDPILDLEYDDTHSVLWTTTISSGANQVVAYDKNDFSINCISIPDSPTTDPAYLGVTYCPPPIDKAYAVDGQGRVIKLNANEAAFPAFNDFTYSILNILDAAAKPVRIKFNAQDNLVYIPTWGHDTVEVLNPATDTIVAIKTGFTDPFDVVFSPTKKFAVQNSSVGLREIT